MRRYIRGDDGLNGFLFLVELDEARTASLTQLSAAFLVLCASCSDINEVVSCLLGISCNLETNHLLRSATTEALAGFKVM